MISVTGPYGNLMWGTAQDGPVACTSLPTRWAMYGTLRGDHLPQGMSRSARMTQVTGQAGMRDVQNTS